MGKDKTGQRRKNHARPSSSGRSAEMLGSAPLNPFLSFSTLKESVGKDDPIPDHSLDPNFQLVLKKMNKKDSLTKLKALQEFHQLCKTSESEAVIAVLPFWPRLYSSLALDTDHRIREATQLAHSAVLSQVKRNLAPYLKLLVGSWFVAQCDTYAPAATVASQAFRETFPQEKLSKAIAHCQDEILNYIIENLINHTPQTLCNSNVMTSEEMESKYLRTVTSSLQGYSLYLCQLSNDQLLSAKELNRKLICDQKFWKYSRHQSPQVRCAWFRAVISLCQNAQFLLEGEEKRVSIAIFNALDENEATVLPVVWEAALVALVTQSGLWEAVSFDKLVLPKLLHVCREAGSGCAAVIFPSLLPLLSKIPQQFHHDSQFYSKLFDSIRIGFLQRSVQHSTSESKAVASAFIECLQYVCQQHSENEDLCFELLHQQLLPSISSSLVEASWKPPMCDALYSSVSKLLHIWGRSSKGCVFQKLLHTLCTQISNSLKEMVMKCMNSPDIVDSSDNFEETSNSAQYDKARIEPSSNSGGSIEVNKSFSSLLKSQVNFIIQLLKTEARPHKVKFNDEPPESSAVLSLGKQAGPCENTVMMISAIGRDLCCSYLMAAKQSECVEFLLPLVTLSKHLHGLSLFSAMAHAVGLSSERALFPELFSHWLKPGSSFFSRAVITLSSLLLHYLPVEDQSQLLESILQHNPNSMYLLWMLEEGIMLDGTVASWVRSPCLAEPVKILTKKALTSKETDCTWTLLCQGADLAADGDHVLCCEVLRQGLDVIMQGMEALCKTGEDFPSWIPCAVDFLQKLFMSNTPFFISLSDPHVPLSIIFQFSLFLKQDGLEEKSMSSVWKNGIAVLASVYGPTSNSVIILCSSLKNHVQALLFQKNQSSIDLPLRISSLLSDFIITSSNSCLDEEMTSVTCCLLLNELFCQSQLLPECDRKEADEFISNLKKQKASLQALVYLYNPTSDLTQASDLETNLSGSQMDLLAMGYWGCMVSSVIEKVAGHSLTVPDIDSEPQALLSQSVSSRLISDLCKSDIFRDTLLLLTDLKCIVTHYLSTELGSSLQQPYNSMENSVMKVFSLMSESLRKQLHDLLWKREWEEDSCLCAHGVWHCLLPSDNCSPVDTSRNPHPNESPCFKTSLDNPDFSLLNRLSKRLPLGDINPLLRNSVSEWISLIHCLHMNHDQRLLLSGDVGSALPKSVIETYLIMTFLTMTIEYAPDVLESRNWDQVMVAVASWIHSSHETVMSAVKDHPKFRPCTKVCIFLRGASRLFVALNKALSKMESDSLKLEGLNESLPREWNDIFAGECEHKLLAIWTIFVENIDSPAVPPPIVATLDELGCALQHSTLAFLAPSKGVPIKFQPLLDLAPPFLLHNLGCVRVTAYHLLLKIVPHMVKSDADMLAAVTSKVESGDIPLDYAEIPRDCAERLTLPGFEHTLIHTQTIVSTMLSDIRLGSTCTVQPFTDAFTYTSGYLLVWSLMLEMCKAAETELRYQYAIWMKNTASNCVEMLLNNIFRLLPEKVLQHSEGKKKTSIDVFTKKPSFNFQDCWSSSWIEVIACSVLLEAMGRLPALARQWWKDCDPKSATLIERVVAEYLSPTLCFEEMAAVVKMQDKAVDNMVVRVHPAVREVVATYTVDDVAMELIVRLPSNHPLSPMVVDIGKRDSAATGQWRLWLMQLTMFLTHQNGSLWDGLELWRNNIVRRYEGVEECYICYCVLSGSNLQLPKLSCRTCRKKFHSNCLYKWFQTSNKSTCPICRNLF